MWTAPFRSLLGNKVVRNEDIDPSKPQESTPSAPIQYEQYAKEFSQITQQDNFDGFRMEAGKLVTPLLQATHSLYLGTTFRECGYMYNFGPVFQSKDQRTILIGKFGLDGMVTGRVIKKLFGDAGELKIVGNSSMKDAQRNMYEVTLDYAGKNWAATSKIAWQTAWIFNGAFSQKITPHLHVGGELTHINIPSGPASIIAAGFRYAKDKNMLSGQFSQSPDFKNPVRQQKIHKAQIQYVRKVTDRLSLAAEYEYSVPDQESAMKVGYEYAFRQARVQGLIDTSGCISCVAQDAQGLGVSATIDYVKSDYKFGFLMHIYPPTEDPTAEKKPEGI